MRRTLDRRALYSKSLSCQFFRGSNLRSGGLASDEHAVAVAIKPISLFNRPLIRFKHQFAAGKRDYDCSPWSTVTFTPKGWKAPCYLIEGEGYHQEWADFWGKTDWTYWESRDDDRCRNCKMHSGFEHSAVNEAMKSVRGQIQLAAWAIGV